MGMTDGGDSGGKTMSTGGLLLALLLGAAILAYVMVHNRTVPITPPGQFGPSVSASPSK